MTNNSSHICPVCAKSYKRPEHLRRHFFSHRPDRPHRCHQCESAFQRSDVLKRHLKTCERVSQPQRRRSSVCTVDERPNNAAVGEFSTATELVTPPLQPSLINNVGEGILSQQPLPPPSTWYPVADSASEFAFSDGFSDVPWADILSVDLGNSQPPAASQDVRKQRFQFLNDFTSHYGLAQSFGCGTLAQRSHMLSGCWECQSTGRDDAFGTFLQSSPSDLVPFNTLPYLEHDTWDGNDCGVARIASSWISDPYAAVTNDITSLIRKVVVVKSRRSIVTHEWTPLLHHMSLRFFSPPQIRKYLSLYWGFWHPQVNFIHKPTFDVLASKSILVAAMTLIGACLSPDAEDRDNAKMWLNCVEELVFTDDDLLEDSDFSVEYGSKHFNSSRNRLQALQAAYLVVLFQNWEGVDKSRRRVRRERFSTIVSVARDIGLHTAQQLDYSQLSANDFVWTEFVLREELIRVFLWIFLIDTAFVIFNNLPPRLVIKEMKMHMACTEATFQASTARTCWDQIQRDLELKRESGNIKALCSAVELLCKDSGRIPQDQLLALADLGPLNLFSMTSALHSLIFHYQNSLGCHGQLIPVRNAIHNWREAWLIYQAQSLMKPRYSTVGEGEVPCRDFWRQIGFVRHAAEYWLLASFMLEKISTAAEASAKQDETVAGGSGGGGDASTAPDAETSTPTVEPMLGKYDETSMQQVHDLLADFQNMYITTEIGL
ncbi:hypothetical protein PV08_01845 [Exophiala spinifera]|uniref:C2H2-type domain-containing protein n=1 Tax=Exophiala spinifera TaxID=91928 RepID=A0A0D2BS52_9EURO|nr:uncharacterized protein PV08_01845 [Exophiala spinifera]KIW21265.1 hypothetical protein PV08_01845 [Exophiala spinifera]